MHKIKILYTTCLSAAAVLAVGVASANDETGEALSGCQTVGDAGGQLRQHPSFALKQITAENVGKLQVAWSFSTGCCAAMKVARWWSAT